MRSERVSCSLYEQCSLCAACVSNAKANTAVLEMGMRLACGHGEQNMVSENAMDCDADYESGTQSKTKIPALKAKRRL